MKPSVLNLGVNRMPRAIAPPRQLSACLLFLLAVPLLAGCGSRTAPPPNAASPQLPTGTPIAASSPDRSSPRSSDKPAAPAAPAAPQSLAAPISPTAAPRLITVTVYQADDQCVNFVPEQVQVPADRPMQAAVGKVLEKQGDGDFDLGGYRVSLNAQTGEATIDLRLVPGSKRQIVSLSACEQFALFGSLRETLMKNPEWNVKSVRFTERGDEIVL
ncbi:hypothetical protein P7L53_12965 [Thermoleptolyngbya sichuanensis XZ-Cy5]|uniref:hypothetical protein n=1 Tax=Thermoleptolyngbya sichuanensis TaxID=2885951 RepID=UPI00240DFD06|nr:hypothetical protein [Thermoleptolyngbya sichuanensis]MDG2617149.1 hypothetical protein [Thermoleptolyngbya sichuanensis XZ-Cy5]